MGNKRLAVLNVNIVKMEKAKKDSLLKELKEMIDETNKHLNAGMSCNIEDPQYSKTRPRKGLDASGNSITKDVIIESLPVISYESEEVEDVQIILNILNDFLQKKNISVMFF